MQKPLNEPRKTQWKSEDNLWKINGKSIENKNGKKEMFPWFSMPTSFWAQNPQKWAQKLGSDLTPNGIIID